MKMKNYEKADKVIRTAMEQQQGTRTIYVFIFQAHA